MACKRLVAVACFLPGRAKDLSSPRYGGVEHSDESVLSAAWKNGDACLHLLYNFQLSNYVGRSMFLYTADIRGRQTRQLTVA